MYSGFSKPSVNLNTFQKKKEKPSKYKIKHTTSIFETLIGSWVLSKTKTCLWLPQSPLVPLPPASPLPAPPREPKPSLVPFRRSQEVTGRRSPRIHLLWAPPCSKHFMCSDSFSPHLEPDYPAPEECGEAQTRARNWPRPQLVASRAGIPIRAVGFSAPGHGPLHTCLGTEPRHFWSTSCARATPCTFSLWESFLLLRCHLLQKARTDPRGRLLPGTLSKLRVYCCLPLTAILEAPGWRGLCPAHPEPHTPSPEPRARHTTSASKCLARECVSKHRDGRWTKT